MPLMSHLTGLVVLVPIGIFLTISFFILVVLRSLDPGALKTFGRVIVAILWMAAFLFAILGSYELITGKHPAIDFLKSSISE